ncbi:hypothetical protein CK203_096227 [Vitis vinifera]|uniref:Retrotransposon gag domain-containing protein n=1 Tax=Vitis vinifera TaxID=29760 RepID=A0A438EEY1_VITVI|nr:hypothetical protein CK203_096227 [Vitis vinifera]
MAPSHRKKTVGKRATTKSSPLGDRKIKKRKRGTTHLGFNIRASSLSAFKRPSSKLEARTRVNISWDSGSYPRNIQPKRQCDRKSQLSNSMRARLSPQEPGKPRPPAATTWAARPDPMVTPMVQNVLPHRDPMVTPMVRNVHSHLAYSPPVYKSRPLSWFHRLPPNSVGNFRDLSEAFVGQYLCSARHKQNISTLQNIKMQDNESLREFVKRFGQVVLQVEACSMDVVLQIFKRSICPGTPFFESLAKKPLTTMNDLFRRANKYSMLEDDVRAATQQVLVAGQASRSGMERSAKLPDRPRPSDRRQKGPSRPERPPLTPLSISYEKLLPMIQGLSDFRWPRPLGTDPTKRDHSKRCVFHKEHGHTTEECRCLHYLVVRLIRAGNLKQYLRSDTKGSSDEEYDSKRKRQKLLRDASVRERINSIRPGLTGGGLRSIDGTIIFPPVDPTPTLQPHRDALILSLEIRDFNMRRILVYPGNSANLVQASSLATWGTVSRTLKT